MTGWTPDVSQTTIIANGMIQGAGLGFLFVPLSTVTLGTLPPEQRTEGAGLYNLSRNIGSSVGISVVTSLLTQNTQANHADIVQHVTAVNRVFEIPAIVQCGHGTRAREAEGVTAALPRVTLPRRLHLPIDYQLRPKTRMSIAPDCRGKP
jgi:MFS transporter, DHA2 family, multidrug resistance protein